MRLTKDEFRKWQDWIGKIEIDVRWLLTFRRVYETFESVVAENVAHIEANEGGLWCLFIRRSFGDHSAMAVRRHLKCDKESVSLRRLLVQLNDCANQFTYDRYLEFFPIENPTFQWQRSTYDRFSDDGRTLSSAKIAADMQQLHALGHGIEGFADMRIAHLDNREVLNVPSAADLNNAIDLFDKLVCRYRLLLAGASMTTVEPYNPFDWERIFRVALDQRHL